MENVEQNPLRICVGVKLLLDGFFPVLLSLKPVKLKAHFKVSSQAIQWLNKGIFFCNC